MKQMKAKDKLKLIGEGWLNYTFPSPEVEALAKERAAICAECPHLEVSKFWQALPMKGITLARGARCGLCTCPIATATRAPEYKCPDIPARW